jgi:hypothetical protein
LDRRITIDDLRTADLMTIEVHSRDVLGRPMRQLMPGTLVDLLAVLEAEHLPEALQHSFSAFSDRIKQEIADLPAGSSWSAWLEELVALEPTRVPAGFRTILTDELQSDRRTGPERKELENWLKVLEAIEPDRIVLSTENIKVTKVTGRSADDSGGTKPRAKKRASAPRKVTKAVVDPERQHLIEQLCVQRLRGKVNGLKELVLAAGVCHRAKEHYPNLTPNEVVRALKELAKRDRVHVSAGRWKLV